MTITKFIDLNTWKEAHKLVLQTYKLTDDFPRKEQFSLTDQMRRAVVSISSNIAEGFTRFGSKEKKQFYFIAKASLTELENQLLISKDVGYINSSQLKELFGQTEIVGKMLTGLIKSVHT
jgi:four helix bundle protein